VKARGKKSKSGQSTFGYPKRRVNLGHVLAALLFLAIILWNVAPPSSAWIEENYSRNFYQRIASILVPITSSVPFSISALLLVLIPITWLVWTMWSFRQHRFLRWLWRTVLLAGILYAIFIFNWGINYGRESIETQLDLSTESFVEADLQNLVDTLGQIIQNNANAERDITKARDSLRSSLIETVETITGVTPVLPTWVKFLPAGSLIRAGNASGVIAPFTLEPHVDGALSEVHSLAVGGHELAHITGYAGEADTDFLAALAGLNSADPYARYATALKLWNDAVRQLPETQRTQAVAALPQLAREDLQAMYEPFQRYQLPLWIQNLQGSLYNRYLTSQGVEAGIQDYSRTTTLLLAAQRKGLF
jgi:Protein of unknown function (DUF3810)